MSTTSPGCFDIPNNSEGAVGVTGGATQLPKASLVWPSGHSPPPPVPSHCCLVAFQLGVVPVQTQSLVMGSLILPPVQLPSPPVPSHLPVVAFQLGVVPVQTHLPSTFT